MIPSILKTDIDIDNGIVEFVRKIEEESCAEDHSGRKLVPSKEKLKEIVSRASARVKLCRPPPVQITDGVAGWKMTGKKDGNGFSIWKSLYHSCE